jgi:hypothetical protein
VEGDGTVESILAGGASALGFVEAERAADGVGDEGHEVAEAAHPRRGSIAARRRK